MPAEDRRLRWARASAGFWHAQFCQAHTCDTQRHLPFAMGSFKPKRFRIAYFVICFMILTGLGMFYIVVIMNKRELETNADLRRVRRSRDDGWKGWCSWALGLASRKKKVY